MSMSVLQISAIVTQMLHATIPLEVSHVNATMDSQEMEHIVMVCIMSAISYFSFWGVPG